MAQSFKRGREDDDEAAQREKVTGESALRPQQVPSASPNCAGRPYAPRKDPDYPG